MKSCNSFGGVAVGVLPLLVGGIQQASAQAPSAAHSVPAALAEWTPPGASVPGYNFVKDRFYEGTMVSSAPYAQVLKFFTDKAGYSNGEGAGPFQMAVPQGAYAHYTATPGGRSMTYALPLQGQHTQKADLVVVTATGVCMIDLTHDAAATTTDIVVRLVPQQYAPSTQANMKR